MSSKSQGVGGAKVPSVLLTLTGIAIVAIQTYVFISFKDIADSYGPFALYNGMAMASGIVSCLAGISALCCTASKRRSSLGFNIFMAVFSAIAAAGSATLSAMESSRIHSKDSQHPCSSIIEEDSSNNSSVDCNLWFDLQVSVAALSVFSFILSLILIIAISVALSKSKKKSKRSTVQVPDPVIVQEMEHIPSPVVVVNMPVIVEEIESIVPELKEIEVAEEPEPEEINTISGTTNGTNTNNSRQPYIEQLKMLSREELERRLGEHMQQQFLEELRSELNRRNLIPINGRQISRSSSSGSSSHRVSSNTVPVAPRPDYYHEDYL